MRLTSGFVVSALIRQVEAHGAYATVAQRGDEQAGAIFVIVDGLAGAVDLYGPAMAGSEADAGGLDPALTGNRLFVKRGLKPEPTRAAAEEVLAKERQFDSDLWVLDIEDRQRRCFVPLARD